MSFPELLNETYEIQRIIGKGGMSVVYLARHRRLNSLWAVKEVRRVQNSRFDFLAEANLLKQLSHPMLPRIADIFDTPEAVYLVEEYVEGQDLRMMVRANGPFPEPVVRNWMLRLCDVLDYLHNQTPAIIYRDMKPANIMLLPDGSLKLIDFGIARTYKATSLSDTTMAGTRGFAAPEQFSGRQTNARTDIYSLGVTIYYLLTGKSPSDPPYELLPLRQVNPSLSAGMEAIVTKCTQPEPEDRYQDVRRLRFALQQPAAAAAPSASAKKPRWLRRVLCTAAALILVAGAAAGGVFLYRYSVQKQNDALYSDGMAALNAGAYDTAVSDFEELLDRDPQRNDALLGLGDTCLARAEAAGEDADADQVRGWYDQARTAYETAEQQGSAEAQARLDTCAASLAAFEKHCRQMELIAAAYEVFATGDGDAMDALLSQEDYQTLFDADDEDPIVYGDDPGYTLVVYPYHRAGGASCPGFYYYGDWQNNQRSGLGIWYYIDSGSTYRYVGSWANDLPNGEGVVYAATLSAPEQTPYDPVYTLWERSTGTFTDGYFDGDIVVEGEKSDGSTYQETTKHDMGYHVRIPYDELPAYCTALFSREEIEAIEEQGQYVSSTYRTGDGQVVILLSTPDKRCSVLFATKDQQ